MGRSERKISKPNTAGTTAIITTDPFFGPWNIPSRGQNMIMNFYAHQKKINVDTIIPEPLFSKSLSTTRWTKKKKNIGRIILCSIHQLDESKREELIADLQDLEIHFVLEDLSGSGRAFLEDIFNELKAFKTATYIDLTQVHSYQDMLDLLRRP